MANEYVKKQIEDFLEGKVFAASEITLSKADAKQWVKMRSNPARFQPQIFLGTWADPNSHPTAETIRLLRVMTGPDEVTRAIARQGKHLYCYPWM
jgi:hypothetical protein